MFRLFYSVFIFTFSGLHLFAQEITKSPQYDSIVKYRSLAEDSETKLELRYKYAKKAVDISEKMKVDSVILRSNRVLSTVYLFQGKLDDFSKINYKNLKLSRSLKDTLSIGIANHNLGYYHFDKNQNDSAYYYYSTAIKFYDKVEEIPRQAGALSNLSLIQLNEKDYFGSEESEQKIPCLQRNFQTRDRIYSCCRRRIFNFETWKNLGDRR